MSDRKICGIIAAYNARDTIVDVVQGVRRHLATVLVADDGSVDGTGELARQAGAEVVRFARNHGKGHALKILFAEARARGFSAAVAIDADGQHDPEDIPFLLQAHEEHPNAIVTGSRLGQPDRIPRHRYNSMLVARFFISLASNQFIEDTQCGFRLYPLNALESISLRKERYVTETELLIKVGDSGASILSIPIKALYVSGQPTHFRSFVDIAVIARFVISYLMVKWSIEALRPGLTYTYRGPRTGRDFFCFWTWLEAGFEYLTLVAALPLSILFSGWYALGRCLSIPAVRSFGAGGIPVRTTLGSILLLPVLLLISTSEFVARRAFPSIDWTSRFVQRHYGMEWQRSGVR
jgi:glycosyltransferase involved in cell wall biosynthesis